MSPRPILIATCVAICFVVGVYLTGRYTLSKDRPDDFPITSTGKTIEPKQDGNVLGDDTHKTQTNLHPPVMLSPPKVIPPQSYLPIEIDEPSEADVELKKVGDKIQALLARSEKAMSDQRAGIMTVEECSRIHEEIQVEREALEKQLNALPIPGENPD